MRHRLIRAALMFLFLAVCAMAMAEPGTAPSGPAVKLSKSGICHDRKSPYYTRTKHFKPFNNMAECIKAGGRPPKK